MADDGPSVNMTVSEKSPPRSGSAEQRNGHSMLDSEDYDSEDSVNAPLDFSMKAPKENGVSEIKNGNSDHVSDRSEHHRAESDRISYRSVDMHDGDSRSSNSSADPIGEPKPVTPSSLSGAAFSNLAMLPGLKAAGIMPNAGFLASLPNMSAFYDPRNLPQDNLKGARPFKAYQKDAMSLPIGYYGVPGCVPLPNVDQSTIANINKTTEELYEMYKQQLLKIHNLESKKRHRGSGLFRGDTKSPLSDSPATPSPSVSSPPPLVPDPSSGALPTSSPPTSGGNTPSSRGRKRARSLPDEQKDQAYWERRRKNNEAAKRSRDTRRAKEDEIAIRAALLEQENLKLRVEVAALKTETAKLKCLLQNGN